MINISEFDETYSDFEKEDMYDILNIFLFDYNNRMETIENSISRGDWETLESQSHRIKGSIAIFFDEDARQAANKLEGSCIEKDKKLSKSFFIKFKKEADKLFLSLSEMRNDLGVEKK